MSYLDAVGYDKHKDNIDCVVCKEGGQDSENRCVICRIRNSAPNVEVTSHDDMRATAMLAIDHGLTLTPAMIDGSISTTIFTLLLNNKIVCLGSLDKCKKEITRFCK